MNQLIQPGKITKRHYTQNFIDSLKIFGYVAQV